MAKAPLPLLTFVDRSTFEAWLALRGLREVWRPGYRIHKAGVILLDLTDAAIEQAELALEDEPAPRRRQLSQVLDRVNDRYGRGTLHAARVRHRKHPSHAGLRSNKILAFTGG